MGGISGLLAPDAIVEMKIVEWNKVLGNCLFLLDKKKRTEMCRDGDNATQEDAEHF